MKINRSELKDALEKVFPALQQKTLGKDPSFIFSKRNIIAYNGVIGIAYPFKTDFILELPAEEFYKLISLSSIDDMEIGIKNTASLEIQGKGLSAEIKGFVPTLDLDFIDNASSMKRNKIPQDLKEAFELCLFSISVRGPLVLQCISIHDNFVWSTDSYRVSRYQIDKFPSMLIPSVAIESIIKYDISQYSIQKNGNRIYFFGDNGIVICSQLTSGSFPSCASLFQGFGDKEILIPKQIKEALDIASIFSGNDESEKKIDKKISIEITKHKWVLRGQNDYGWIKKEIADTNKNNPFVKFFINPFLFKQVIEKAVSIFYSSSDNKILLRNGNFEHILALSKGDKDGIE